MRARPSPKRACFRRGEGGSRGRALCAGGRLWGGDLLRIECAASISLPSSSRRLSGGGVGLNACPREPWGGLWEPLLSCMQLSAKWGSWVPGRNLPCSRKPALFSSGFRTAFEQEAPRWCVTQESVGPRTRRQGRPGLPPGSAHLPLPECLSFRPGSPASPPPRGLQ